MATGGGLEWCPFLKFLYTLPPSLSVLPNSPSPPSWGQAEGEGEGQLKCWSTWLNTHQKGHVVGTPFPPCSTSAAAPATKVT